MSYLDLFRFVITETMDLIIKFGDIGLKVLIVVAAILIPLIGILTALAVLFSVIATVFTALGKAMGESPADKSYPQDRINLREPVQPFSVDTQTQPDRKKNYYKHKNSKGVEYILNKKDVTLRGGKVQTIFYFSRDERPEACALPGGYAVQENPRNGFLTVRKTYDY